MNHSLEEIESRLHAQGIPASAVQHSPELARDPQLAHLGNFGAHFAERFMDCVTPTSIDVYGEPSDEVRAALAGFGAVHHGTFGGFSR